MVADMTNAGPLVGQDDLTKFEEGDPEFFMRAAEDEVRKYCGWHIAPSLTVTDRFSVGERGIIMLPSMHVTGVLTVSVDGRTLDPAEYDWDPAGFITRNTRSWPQHRAATVTFTHGYPAVPPNVKAVILEVASKAIEMPASPARDVTAGPFRLTLSGAMGVALSRDQQNRLQSYRIDGIA